MKSIVHHVVYVVMIHTESGRQFMMVVISAMHFIGL